VPRSVLLSYWGEKGIIAHTTGRKIVTSQPAVGKTNELLYL